MSRLFPFCSVTKVRAPGFRTHCVCTMRNLFCPNLYTKCMRLLSDFFRLALVGWYNPGSVFWQLPVPKRQSKLRTPDQHKPPVGTDEVYPPDPDDDDHESTTCTNLWTFVQHSLARFAFWGSCNNHW